VYFNVNFNVFKLIKVHFLVSEHYICTDLFTINTLRTGDVDLRFYITTVQDG